MGIGETMSGHIEERRRSDGMTAYRLKLSVGKRRYIAKTMPRGTTPVQVERKLAELVDAGLSATSAATLSDIWRAYSRSGLSRLTPGTRTRYRSTWNRQIKPRLGSRRLVTSPLAKLKTGFLTYLAVDLRGTQCATAKRCLALYCRSPHAERWA
jgi:hypothetical protein